MRGKNLEKGEKGAAAKKRQRRKKERGVLGGGPGGGEKEIFSAAEGGFSGDPEMRSLELGEREENG